MSKICGYSCEHNKSGVCQISVCDKKSNISDKTEVQTFTRYIDPTITELQQENKKQSEKIKEVLTLLENFNADQVCTHTTRLSNEIEKTLRGVSE